MSNNIEDIYIGDKYRSTNKKGGKLILFFIIILLLILFGMGYAYWYINNYEKLNAKQLFFNHLSNNNIKNIASENIYAELIEKLVNSNFESNSTMNFSTNVEREELEGLDVSKFTLNLKNQHDVNAEKTYSELGIVYSGNEALRIKMITDKDSIAIKDADKEIVTMYVGMRFNSLKDRFGINISKENIDNLKRLEKNELTKEDTDQFMTDMLAKLSSMIPEEKFTIQDNIAISQNNDSIPVTAYSLNLSQEEFKTILTEILKNVRNNETFLKKFATEGSKNEIGNKVIDVNPGLSNTEENEELIDNQNPEEMFVQEGNEQFTEDGEQIPENQEQYTEEDEEVQDYQESESDFEPVPAEVNEFNEPQVYEEENLEDNNENRDENYEENNQDENHEENNFEQNEEILEDNNENYIEENLEEDSVGSQELQLMRSTDLNPLDEEREEELEILNHSSEYLEIMKLLLGMKVDKSLDEITDLLDEWIENTKDLTGNGISITVYASSEKTEKISVTLPSENTIEIEVLKKSDSNNRLKITYLYENLEEQKDGISLQINKTNTTSNTALDIICSFIENEKINKKLNIQSEIEGAVTSNTLKSNSIITLSTQDNETKFVSETDIKFSKKPEIEVLNEENCLFLETLSQEEYEPTIQAVKEQIKLVWNAKKENFDFIDTNHRNLLIQTPTNPLSDTNNEQPPEEQLPEQQPSEDESQEPSEEEIE